MNIDIEEENKEAFFDTQWANRQRFFDLLHNNFLENETEVGFVLDLWCDYLMKKLKAGQQDLIVFAKQVAEIEGLELREYKSREAKHKEIRERESAKYEVVPNIFSDIPDEFFSKEFIRSVCTMKGNK